MPFAVGRRGTSRTIGGGSGAFNGSDVTTGNTGVSYCFTIVGARQTITPYKMNGQDKYGKYRTLYKINTRINSLLALCYR